MNKIIKTATEGIKDVKSGMTLMFGGFGLCGIPELSIEALKESSVKNLTCISNNAGVDGFGLGLLLEKRQIKKMISSYVGENKLFAELFLSGELDVELTPQGTLAEKIRAGGAGIPGFFTATGVGTKIAEGKMHKDFNGRTYILEESLTADFSFIKAKKADTYGNLIFSKTAENFNPIMATAAKTTIAEVEEIVDIGELSPNEVHLPGVYIQKILVSNEFEKRIEQRTTRSLDA